MVKKFIISILLILVLTIFVYANCYSVATATIDAETKDITIYSICYNDIEYDAILKYDPVSNVWFLFSLVEK